MSSNGKVESGETYFPRKTLDRHLKTLIKKGIVEKLLEPRKKGQKGRQSTRYRIKPSYWHSWGSLILKVPAKKVGTVPFFGRRKRRLGTEFVSLFPGEKKKVEEHKAYLKHMKNRDWLKEHHPQGFKKLLKLEHEKKGRATDKELMEIMEEVQRPASGPL